jgi:hypothetical protein
MSGHFYDYDFVKRRFTCILKERVGGGLECHLNQTSKNAIRVLRCLVKMSEANMTNSNYLHSPISPLCHRVRPGVFANALQHRPITLEQRPRHSPVQSEAEKQPRYCQKDS